MKTHPAKRDGRGDDGDALSEPAARALGLLENVVYALTGLALVVGAATVLVATMYRLVRDLGDGAQAAVTGALDGLLLVFILLELLAGLRATMSERKLIAEPFLVAGIIASIKEIIVTGLKLDDVRDQPGGTFIDALIEIGVLAGVVLVLATATLLVRRKEREPEE